MEIIGICVAQSLLFTKNNFTLHCRLQTKIFAQFGFLCAVGNFEYSNGIINLEEYHM